MRNVPLWRRVEKAEALQSVLPPSAEPRHAGELLHTYVVGIEKIPTCTLVCNCTRPKHLPGTIVNGVTVHFSFPDSTREAHMPEQCRDEHRQYQISVPSQRRPKQVSTTLQLPPLRVPRIQRHRLPKDRPIALYRPSRRRRLLDLCRRLLASRPLQSNQIRPIRISALL